MAEENAKGGKKGSAQAQPVLPSKPLPPRPTSYTAAELAEMERRERLGGWLLLFFGGAAMATAALAFYMFSDDIEQNDEYIRLDPEGPAEEDDSPFFWGQTEPEPEPTQSPEAEIVEQRTITPRRTDSPTTGEPIPTTAEQTFNFPPPPREEPAPTFAGPRPDSVDRETSRALRSGKAQLWREDGERGYVLVSDIVAYGARECRQVSYTRFERGRQLGSPATQWCRVGKGGKWRRDPRGPE